MHPRALLIVLVASGYFSRHHLPQSPTRECRLCYSNGLSVALSAVLSELQTEAVDKHPTPT